MNDDEQQRQYEQHMAAQRAALDEQACAGYTEAHFRHHLSAVFAVGHRDDLGADER